MALRTTPSQKQDLETPRHPLTDQLSPFTGIPTRSPAHLVRVGHDPNIAAVISISNEVDAEGAPVSSTTHLVGARCQHWAPDAERTGDCRFGCVKRAAAAEASE